MVDQEMNQNTEPGVICINGSMSINQLMQSASAHGLRVDLVIVDDVCGPGLWDTGFSELERHCMSTEEFRQQYLCEWPYDIHEPVQVDEPKKKTRPFAPIPPWDRRYRKY